MLMPSGSVKRGRDKEQERPADYNLQQLTIVNIYRFICDFIIIIF